jgi:hypothetical protein
MKRISKWSLSRIMIRKCSANPSRCLAAALVFTATVLSMPTLSAQNLPPPSRTMYKCKVNGTTTYSDVPCLGAERLDVEPTRGVGKLSGTERIGKDVSFERWHESFAQALSPVTGMNAQQLTQAGRRNKLSPVARQECQQLDQAIPLAESEEKHAAQPALRDVQMRLFQMRQRFRDLRC